MQKMSNFCLKQGQVLKASAAHFHPNSANIGSYELPRDKSASGLPAIEPLLMM